MIKNQIAKNKILAFRQEFNIWELKGRTLKDVAESLSQRANNDNSSYPESELIFTYDTYGYDGGAEFYIECWRDETDEEYNKRIEENKKAQVRALRAEEAKKEKARRALYKKEADEREEYERLKKKFG